MTMMLLLPMSEEGVMAQSAHRNPIVLEKRFNVARKSSRSIQRTTPLATIARRTKPAIASAARHHVGMQFGLSGHPRQMA